MRMNYRPENKFFILHEGPLGVFNDTLKEFSYEDIEEEECHDDDIMSSTIGDEDDPRLCSPMTDSEDKSSPSPKQHRTITSPTKSLNNTSIVTSADKDFVVKPVKGRKKSKSPDDSSICETVQTKSKSTCEEECALDKQVNNQKV